MTKAFFTPLRDPKRQLFIYESLVSPKGGTEQFLFKPTKGLRYDFGIASRAEDADVVIESSPVTRGTAADWKPYPVPAGKPYLVQVGGDLSHDVFIDAPEVSVVLKVTQYRSLKRPNEVIMPPFCEDLGASIAQGGRGFSPRPKRSGPWGAKPVVSFCGWAGFPDLKILIKYTIKNLLVDLKKVVRSDSSLEVFKKGIYFRRKALRAFEGSDRVETSFIVRDSFSGSASTIAGDPEQARKEYIDNMVDSDFILAPKGDANYSVRFFEALSLGRVPILIDTDVCLPLEDELDYSKFILRVSYKDIAKLPEIVADFYAKISPAEWLVMQTNARRAFETCLRYDSYWNSLIKSAAKGRKL